MKVVGKGNVDRVNLAVGDEIVVCRLHGGETRTKVTKLYAFDGLKRIDIASASLTFGTTRPRGVAAAMPRLT